MADNLFLFQDQELKEEQSTKKKNGPENYDFDQISKFIPENSQVYQPGKRKKKGKNNLGISKNSNKNNIIKETQLETKSQVPDKNQQNQSAFLSYKQVPKPIQQQPRQNQKNVGKKQKKEPQQQIKEQKTKTVKKDYKVPPKSSNQSLRLILPQDVPQDDMDFFYNAVPQGKLMQCTIRRDKKVGWFYPQYDLYLSNGYKYLLSAVKKGGNTTSNYVISNNKLELQSTGKYFVGKLRANFVGTQFNVYDNGLNPQKAKDNISQARRTLATVQYQSNFFGTKGPRKMKALIPRMQQANIPLNFRFDDTSKNLLSEQGNLGLDLIKLINKPPRWNQQMKAYVLNFDGRVDKPSVKNFIMVQEKKPNSNVLLFGRVGQDIFNMDVSYPMSLVQALGITLSSFDGKLALE